MTIKEWMVKEGWTHRKMARALGVTHGMVGHMVYGRINPSLRLAIRIVETTNGEVGFSDLLNKGVNE
jgi:plasmid maintenance system antidote protein VapI